MELKCKCGLFSVDGEHPINDGKVRHDTNLCMPVGVERANRREPMELKIAGCCGGAVDVPSFGGAKLRCGCGQTTIDAPAKPDAPAAHGSLAALLRTLLSFGVRTFEGHGISVEFNDPAPANVWASPEKPAVIDDRPKPDPSCTCGHALTEHNESGCILGCDIETCGIDLKAGANA